MSEPYWVPLGAAPAPLPTLAEPYACLRDEKPQGTGGGTSVVGWQTRTLNVEALDTHGVVTLAANQFTLLPGTYRIFATAPQGAIAASTRLRLRNMTDGVVVLLSATWFPTSGNSNDMSLHGSFVVAGAPKAFELQHYTGAAVATTGLGQALNEAGSIEAFAVVELWKLA